MKERHEDEWLLTESLEAELEAAKWEAAGLKAPERRATEPQAVEPPATQQQKTEQHIAELQATEHPAVEQQATERPATEPQSAESPATEPHATDRPASGKPSPDSLFQQATTFLQGGEWGKALAHFGRVLELEPKNARAYFGMLLALRGAKNIDALVRQARTMRCSSRRCSMRTRQIERN